MKFLTIPSLMLILSLGPWLTSCKKDDPAPLTDQQQATKKLSATWGSAQILSVPVAGAVGTLENLTLTFTATGNHEPASFAASGATDFFQTDATSKWSWKSASSTSSILLSSVSPVQEFTIENLTETDLTISFVFDGPVGGRVGGIGEYRVRLVRE